MRNIIIIILAIVSFNICYGQNSFFFKKNWHSGIKNHHPGNIGLPQIQLRNDLNEQLDSTVRNQWSNTQAGWVTSETHHFTYTNDHQLATESFFFFDLDDGERYYGRQEEYFYNDLGKWNLHYRNFLDPVSGEWTRSDRDELVYNEDLLGIEWITSSWDEIMNQFVYKNKFLFYYTPSNKYQGYVHFSWDGSIWKEAGKQINEYNSNDSLLITNNYTWNDSSAEWQISYRYQYFYTNDTRLDSVIEFVGEEFVLEPYLKIVSMYNAEDLLASETGFLWNGSRWDPNFYDEYEYTPEGYLSVDSYYEWDPDEETFIGDYREEYTYTATGDPQSQTYIEYDTDASDWVPFFRRETFFDDNVDGTTIVWPNPPDYLPETSWHYKPIYQLSSFFDFNQWFVADTTLYFYGDITTSTIPVSKLELSVYPNPASDQIHIQMEKVDPDASIKFFDQQGRLIYASPFREQIPVNISRLTPGAYLFQIQNGTNFYTGKFLKE